MRRNLTANNVTKKGATYNSSPIINAALKYLAARISVIPILADASKRPRIVWKPFQDRRMNEREVQWHFRADVGVAIVCGEVSDNVEVLDFDDPEVFAPWCALVERLAPGLIQRLPVVITPSGGRHVYIRCGVISRNQKLAQGYRNGRITILIETRGTGGYVLAPPSPPACHPTGREYVVSAGSLLAIPEISKGEREALLDAARSFNEVPTPALEQTRRKCPRLQNQGQTSRPGDDFNERVSWLEILQPFGWTPIRTRGEVTYWRKPGSRSNEHHATTGARECGGLLYVFSTAAVPFESGETYTAFRAYALLNHGGDYAAAARELARKGYGAPKADHAYNKRRCTSQPSRVLRVQP